MPHVPLAVSDKFKGKSKRGLYGDVIMEIDWSVGQILDALEDNTASTSTRSSSSPPTTAPGSATATTAGRPGRSARARARRSKAACACRASSAGRDASRPGRECAEPAMTIDLLPTVAKLAGATLPSDRIIDGKDIWPLLAGEAGAKSPHEALYFYWGRELHAVRSGKWKLHLPHPYRTARRPGAGGQDRPAGRGRHRAVAVRPRSRRRRNEKRRRGAPRRRRPAPGATPNGAAKTSATR